MQNAWTFWLLRILEFYIFEDCGFLWWVPSQHSEHHLRPHLGFMNKIRSWDKQVAQTLPVSHSRDKIAPGIKINISACNFIRSVFGSERRAKKYVCCSVKFWSIAKSFFWSQSLFLPLLNSFTCGRICASQFSSHRGIEKLKWKRFPKYQPQSHQFFFFEKGNKLSFVSRKFIQKF